MITDLEQSGVAVDDEDKAIILLHSLPSSYEHVVTTLTFGKESIKVGDITAALLARGYSGPVRFPLCTLTSGARAKSSENKKYLRVTW
jgi:hypothetical protein